MKKNSLIYGLVSGALVSTFMLVTMNYASHCTGSVDMETSMLIGYASMLLAFSLVFVGVRNYRNKYNNGVITFGKAFRIGLMIALISSTVYVIAWMIDFFFFMPDFIDQYAAMMLKELNESGASQAMIDQQVAEMKEFAVLYRNPFFNALMTYMEILPVGLIVSLISALILKRKTPVNA